ncbi:hypothetical protein [Mesorhizobium sp. M7A.T.Ca.TU.009.02.1.1]
MAAVWHHRIGILGESDMKKIYVKPSFLKKGRLSAVTAANGSSLPTPQ